MIVVQSLHVYPVKSCRGIDLDHAEVATTGFRHDRRWMVVGPDGGFLSQRSHPALATVATRLEPERLVLACEDRPPLGIALDGSLSAPRTVTLWGDACDALSEGPAAASWLSSVLETPCELVRLADDRGRGVDPEYAAAGDRVGFADGFPFLLISQASVDQLNRRLSEPVPTDRFRANIVIAGCPPHAEDRWTALEIGDVSFRVAKPCARCVIVNTDQRAGTRSSEPLQTLARYRQVGGRAMFGQNLVHRSTGTIRVGDVLRPTGHR